MGTKIYQDARWLEQKYWEEGLSLARIGKIADTTDAVIKYWMDKTGIETRSLSDAAQLVAERDKGTYDDPEWLRRKYWDEELSLSEIAEVASCQSEVTILRAMEKYDIPRRSKADIGQRRIEGKVYTDKEWLVEKYSGEQLDAYQIAEIVGCTQTTIYKWLRRHGIERRSNSEASKLLWARGTYDGENHPQWRGGLSFEPYPPTFNKRFKRMIRARDDYTCAICRLPGKDVHHVNYVKEDTNPMNCITLCRSCHGATCSNRPYWRRTLTRIMLARGYLETRA